MRLLARPTPWERCPDKVAAELEALRHSPEPGLIEHARRLFARVLDTPGGMKIATIHAFCQSVMRRFPI